MSMINTEITLEFNTIRENLCRLAYTQSAKQRISGLHPFTDEALCLRAQRETSSARNIIDCLGAPPVTSMDELGSIRGLCRAGGMLTPEQLESVDAFLAACKRMKSYLKSAESIDDLISGYGRTIDDLPDLRDEISRCIRNAQVDSNASAALRSVRRRIDSLGESIKAKLESILKSKRAYFSDGFYSVRDGRYVLPVKKEQRRQFDGTLVGMSSSGGTCFMEPASVSKLSNELSELRIEEDSEVRRILYELSAFVADCDSTLNLNQQAMETLDFIFAKGRLSVEMRASAADIGLARRVEIISGRHPLLDRDKCVPLDFKLDGGDTRGAVITGPNTGGKTVALKTVGLLSMMAQSGLHVPADPASKFAMFDGFYCDIGDGQSISENLSTFSSHMTAIIAILAAANPDSLVLLDELGSGTDPAEGMGIAVAVLGELVQRGCLFLVTTHYPEVKDFAARTLGIVNARMAFDSATLQPLYRLEQGLAGESCALYIAQRLGMPEHILRRAKEVAYGEAGERVPSLGKEGTEETSWEHDYGADEGGKRAKHKSGLRAADSGKVKEVSSHAASFNVGDGVLVYPRRENGVVFQLANERGELGVQIHGVKQFVNHKRLKLRIPASELYPDGYDMSIVFDSVENRKARHQLDKGHHPGVVVEYAQWPTVNVAPGTANCEDKA